MMTHGDWAAAALLGVVRPLGNSSDFSLIKGIGGVPRWLGGAVGEGGWGGASQVKYSFGNERSLIGEFPAAVTTVLQLTDRCPGGCSLCRRPLSVSGCSAAKPSARGLSTGGWTGETHLCVRPFREVQGF